MALKLTIMSLALAIGVSGCASYGPRDRGAAGSGFTEKRLSDGMYWLRFDGGAYDGYDRLITFWEKRAGELCGPENYFGAPNREATSQSTTVYSAGVVYPPAYPLPFVEGSVECKDKALARQVGPKKYNPGDGIQRLAIGNVVVSQQGAKAGLPQSMQAFLKSDLDAYAPGTASVDPDYLCNVDMVRYIADSGGVLSDGAFQATSIVIVIERRTGRVVGRREISTVVDQGGEKEYNLKKIHSRAIVEYVASLL